MLSVVFMHKVVCYALAHGNAAMLGIESRTFGMLTQCSVEPCGQVGSIPAVVSILFSLFGLADTNTECKSWYFVSFIAFIHRFTHMA